VPTEAVYSSFGQARNSSITLTSSANPSVADAPVVLTAAVSGTNGVPAGTVTFNNGAALLGTAALNDSGVATLTTSALPVGTNALTATYGGAENYLGSASTQLLQVVAVATPSAPPQVISIVRADSNLVLITAGATNSTYRLLTSTNVALPSANWTVLSTNPVGANGLFTNTLPINPADARRFYRLSIP
jgi:hypothetical protein